MHQISKRVIVPLIIVIILAGTSGIFSARELAIRRTQHLQKIDQTQSEYLERQLKNPQPNTQSLPETPTDTNIEMQTPNATLMNL